MSPRSMERMNAASLELRRERKRLKHLFVSGALDFAELLENPELANRLLIDLVRWKPRMGTVKLAALNRRAVRSGHNLVQPVRLASSSTKRWLVGQMSETVNPEEIKQPATMGDGRMVEELIAAIAKHREDIHGTDPEGFAKADAGLYEAAGRVIAARRSARVAA